MLKLKKIAITGSIASGKTRVLTFLRKRGAYVISSDEIVRKLLKTKAVVQEVICLFGPSVLLEGKISKEKLAEEVFSDERKLERFEKIIHPKVFKEIDKIYKQIKKEGKYDLFVVEIPLLFETKKENNYDIVVLITAKTKLCKERSSEKNLKYFDKRKKRLFPISYKKKRSHFIIENNGDLKDLEKKVEKLYLNFKDIKWKMKKKKR